MAKQYHPDLNPDDPIVEQKFKEVGAAYDLLSDPDQRARFDRGEIDADGNRRPAGRARRGSGATTGTSGTGSASGERQRRHYQRRHTSRTRSRTGSDSGADTGASRAYERRYRDSSAADATRNTRQDETVFGDGTADDLFSDIFGDQHHQHYERGADVTYTLRVGFLDVVKGTHKRVSLANGRFLEVEIPPGSENGQTLRLKGQGMPGKGGAPDGDAYVDLKVDAHAFFERHDIDIYVDVPITLHEALSGGRIDVPTVDGLVKLTVPAGTSSGQVLRLKGKGVVDRRSGIRGDQYVRAKIVLPESPDTELTQAVRRWAERNPDDPRKRFGLT